MNGTWVEVRVITISEALEPISGIFYGLDCKGVAIEDPNDILGREQGPLTWDFADINVLEHRGEAAVVKGYFSEDDNVEEIVTYIEQKVNEIKELGINVGEGKVESEVKHEKDWADTWKQYYKPVLVGERIVVKPIWEEYEPKNDELVVELDPGMAFGTGTHETTRMCIQALERYVSEDATVFDVGCGSGILAIAAAKLGAKLSSTGFIIFLLTSIPNLSNKLEIPDMIFIKVYFFLSFKAFSIFLYIILFGQLI